MICYGAGRQPKQDAGLISQVLLTDRPLGVAARVEMAVLGSEKAIRETMFAEVSLPDCFLNST